MAWTYSNYITQATDTLRQSVLEQHIQEVSDKITADVSGGGKSRQNHPLTEYLRMLLDLWNDLRGINGAGSQTVGALYADFRGAAA